MNVKKGWEAAKTASDEAKKAAVGSGKYLRLQDDEDSAVVAFLGEPVVREVIWNGNGYDEFDPEKHKGQNPGVKFGICVYNKEHHKLQLFEQSAGTLSALLTVYEKYGQFKFWFEVKRKGARGNKKTIYTILPDEPITPEEKADMMKFIKEDKLINVELELHRNDDDGEDRPQAKAEEPHDDGGFIGEEDALNIIEKIKMMPREIGKSFLASLEVKRVREIPASRVAKAKSLLAKITAESGADADVDPFT
jgi:hypothetical protein